jgi:ATPase subunit of ABC transporter with duplicated ATPase domains
MIDLNIDHIKKTFGANTLFDNITFNVKTGDRIGLIGPNGCGKTTLLKIVVGKETVQSGTVSFRKDIKVGYLDQIPEYDDVITVNDILNMAFQSIYHVKGQMDALSHQFSDLTGQALDKALKEYTRLTAIFERADGYNIETKINTVCTGLLIDDTLRYAPFNQLSGGEKTRVTLAKILLEKPNLLMLDEPTNHLDLESIEWLEQYLQSYEGSVIVVSHDRYFLDNVCEKLIELSTNKAHIYHGNYSYYVIEKERRFLLELKVYLTQQKEIQRMEEQIKRYRIWGVMRDSDKMFKRAKELEKRLSKIERLDKPKAGNDEMKLKHIHTSRSGKRVLEVASINLAFDDLVLLEDASLELIYQDRLAILGNNGTGKTTLIKHLLHDSLQEEPTHKWGSKLKIGYLAQEIIFEDESMSVIDYFTKKHSVNQAVARKELAKALFIRDDVFKHLSMLSGGEKSKLLLCSLTYNQTNLLILDEPTNHLDIDSREVLEDMLLAFKGTILFISHDRYFIKKIATRIGEIDQRSLTYYEGNYDHFRSIKKRRQKASTQNNVQSKNLKRQNKQKNYSVNQEIETIEIRLSEIDQQMLDNGFDLELLQRLQQEKDELEQRYFSIIEDSEKDKT